MLSTPRRISTAPGPFAVLIATIRSVQADADMATDPEDAEAYLLQVDTLKQMLPKSTVYARWYGGSSYAHSYREDTEAFPSIQAAKDALHERLHDSNWRRMTFVNVYRDEVTTWCPVVDDTSYLDLYASPDSDEMFARLEFGPRGGIVRQNA